MIREAAGKPMAAALPSSAATSITKMGEAMYSSVSASSPISSL